MRKLVIVLLVCSLAFVLVAAQRQSQSSSPPTIESKTESMTRMDGFFPLFWEESTGRLWMEIDRFGTEILHVEGLGAGLGSNDIGLDRGTLAGSRIVRFDRVGPKVLLVQPNYRFRATSDNAAEVKAVTDAFAPSVLWGFTVGAATGDRVLVDLTDFLVRDATNAAGRLRPGNYHFDRARSAFYLPMTRNFPANTDMEVTLTFVRQAGGGPGGGRGGGGAFFEGVGSVAATAEAATIRVHHSFVELPDADYTPRAFDPRSGFGSAGFQDYSVALGESMSRRFIRRHRLEKKDPSAEVSEAVEPIVYYLDPGTPEPIRSALLDGARWWNQAFEAAGYRDAFQVKIRPDDVSPLDIRYNVINWVHRSTRGWSTGASVTDPRTGEIIKGVVTLGSLRVRQDYMIAEGLLAPYDNGDEPAPELAEWALARIRQLSAHEVGHTLGLGHNYYDSEAGRISVLDYPHPLIRLNDDGSFDYSEVYDVGIGEWDKVAVAYGYQDFPEGTDEKAELAAILDEAWDRDIRYLTNQDLSAHPKVDQWSNGTDAAEELNRMMRVRRVALERFGEAAIRPGRPMATLEEVLVPLYLHHRYQVDAAASVLGGQDYIYAFRGDGRRPFSRASAARQQAALEALLATLDPAELKIPGPVLELIPPRPSGFRRTRELFPSYTGGTFDALTPAVVAAGHTVGGLLQGSRSARLVQQKMLDSTLPGLEDVVRQLLETTFAAQPADPYEAEISRAVQRVVAEGLMRLAASATMPQVRSISSGALRVLAQRLESPSASGDVPDRAHRGLLVTDITRFLNRPAEAYQQPPGSTIPPGAPIGQPAPEWLSWAPPYCSHFEK